MTPNDPIPSPLALLAFFPVEFPQFDTNRPQFVVRCCSSAIVPTLVRISIYTALSEFTNLGHTRDKEGASPISPPWTDFLVFHN